MEFREALEWCVNNLQTKWNDKTDGDIINVIGAEMFFNLIGEGYIDYEFNHMRYRNLYYITDKGIRFNNLGKIGE